MNDMDLISYVLGDATPDVATAIEGRTAIDPEFAAEVAVLRSLAGTPAELPPSPTPKRRRFRVRKSVLAILLLLLTATAAYAGYVLTRTPPLLEDSFSSQTVSYNNWERKLGRAGVRAEKGHLRLLNRGSVVTRQEFEGPIEVSFDWRWLDLGTHPHYAETFHVVLNTHGLHEDQHPFQITDGFTIDFNCVAHAVHMGLVHGPYSLHAAPDSTPFPSDEWHHVRIVDDGVSISVFITGPAIDPKYEEQPVLVATPPSRPSGRRIAFFNREYVAGINHESNIDNVVVRSLIANR